MTDSALHYCDDDLPPPDGADLPDTEQAECAARPDLLLWWIAGTQLSHAAGHLRLPGTPLYRKLNRLPDELCEEMEAAASGALGARPRIVGLHRARLRALPVKDSSPRWRDYSYHLCWGFVIQPFYRAACAEIGGRFTTLELEVVS